MSPLIGAAICGLALVSIFIVFTLPFALAWGWLRVRSVLIVGKDDDITEPAEYLDFSQVCQAPYVVDFNDPLSVETHEERTQRIKDRMKNRAPTLSGKGLPTPVPIRTYKEREEVEQDHELQIIKNH